MTVNLILLMFASAASVVCLFSEMRSVRHKGGMGAFTHQLTAGAIGAGAQGGGRA